MALNAVQRWQAVVDDTLRRCSPPTARMSSALARGTSRRANRSRNVPVRQPQQSSIISASAWAWREPVCGPVRVGAKQEAVARRRAANPLGMARGVGHRHRTALAQSEQRKPAQARRINHGLEIADKTVQREVVRVPVGQSAAAGA